MALFVVGLIVVLAALLSLSRVRKALKATYSGSVDKGSSAFAKLADADGKIVALKVAVAAKKTEAVAVHADLDEVHSILG